MCNIWKQKGDNSLSPKDFGVIFKDTLFKNVEHIGVTGGEPTLRGDLDEVCQNLISSLASLKSLSIITNSIKNQQSLERILEVRDTCKKNLINFSVMVSLDGVNEVHDKIRGIPGNFEKALWLIKELKDNDIDVSIGCTISKENVWNVSDLLNFLKENSIYGRFRVAEFIKRLYNEDCSVIKSFTQDETYHLAMFFHKLEMEYEKNETFKRTYRNIREMLLGKTRSIGCPYQSNGVVIGAEGQLSYCAPRSEVVGNAKKDSALEIFKKNIHVRDTIRQKDCSSCIHDYHDEYPFQKYLQTEVENILRKILQFKHFHLSKKILKIASYLPMSYVPSLKVRKILILGWYGTETVGDKAILGGILANYKKQYVNCEFIVASIYPYITERTKSELNENFKVIDAYSINFFKSICVVDEVVMGGGPLMDLEELSIPYLGFYFAKLKNKVCTVYGCGLGPLNFEKYREAVFQILLLADLIKVRDSASVEFAKNLLGNSSSQKMIELTQDPAIKYVESIKSIPTTQVNELCLFLREWTYEYSSHISYEIFLKNKKKLETSLKDLILIKARELGVKKIRFCHMHNFSLGSDDRDFSAKFINTYLNEIKDIEVTYDKGLSTIESITQSMQNSRFNICMRFHSVVFAQTLSVEYLAIDYTLGGKILGFLKDNQALDRLYKIEL